MKSNSAEELIARIDELHQIHLSLRGVMPYVQESHLGEKKLHNKTKIRSELFEVELTFSSSITPQMRSDLNVLSEYLNQNFIIRLHSLIEYEGIKSEKVKIDQALDGFEMIELIHHLRKQYAHRLGKFDLNDPESVKLRHRLFKTFNIDPIESLPDQFPLDKNRVIVPIVKGTKKYVKAFWEKYRFEGNPTLSN